MRENPHTSWGFLKREEVFYSESFFNRLRCDSRNSIYETYWRSAQESGEQILLEIDRRTYLPDDILTKVDRMSMAHSLEVRSPFLDHTLVEFMAKLPRSEKFTLFDRKRLLKEVARHYLPDKIVNRSKKGFSIPLGEWLRGPLLPWLEEVHFLECFRKEPFSL